MNDHDMLLKRITNIPGIDCAALFSLQESDGGLHLVAHHGLSTVFVQANRRIQPDSASVAKIRSGSIWMRDFMTLMRECDNGHALMEGMRAILVVPVKKEDRVMGSLHVASRTDSAFAAQTVAEVEAAAAQLAPAMELLRSP